MFSIKRFQVPCYTIRMTRKLAIGIVLAALMLSPVMSPSPVLATSPRQSTDGWMELAQGVDYREFNLPGPVRAYVARMAVAAPDAGQDEVTLESGVARGQLGSVETVRGMAARYNDAIDFWGQQWGNRSEILVAINGSYFGRSDTPENGMVQSGWYAKRFDDLGGGSGLVWTLNRQVFIGDCVYHQQAKQTLQVDGTGQTILINGINTARKNDQLIIFTPQFGVNTWNDPTGVEVVVQLTRPLLILPLSQNPDVAVVGTVKEIRDQTGSTLIPFDSIVLSASGTQRDLVLETLEVGSTIRINQEISSLKKDCETPNPLPWVKAYTSIGAALHLINSGTINPPSEDSTRAPRTAVAYGNGFIYLIVVDGRQPERSIGMTFQELGQFIRDTLGAQNAVAQDGGGSSTMVVNGSVVNIPSDVCYRLFLPVTINAGDGTIKSPQMPLEEKFEPPMSLQNGCERRVANALMIAKVSAKEVSATSFGNMGVFTTASSVLRVGPGTNYSGITIIPPGTYGEIQQDDNQFNGILAKGAYWWKVSFGGNTGWIMENAIATLAPRVPSRLNQH